METRFAFTKGTMSNLKGPMKEAYEVIRNHVDNLDAINEETEIFSAFKDVKLSDTKNKEALEQHINGVRGKYRKMGLYGTEFANSLMERLGEGKKLTKASENASGNEEFSKNIIKPLEKVIRLSPLDDNNKPQSGYETALKDLINSLIRYKDGNKGISDSDKAMFMYASALVDLINEKGR